MGHDGCRLCRLRGPDGEPDRDESVIDLSAYGRPHGSLTKKSKEDLQRECRWCAHRESNSCQCFEDCKRTHCPMGLEEFMPPPLPTFQENQ